MLYQKEKKKAHKRLHTHIFVRWIKVYTLFISFIQQPVFHQHTTHAERYSNNTYTISNETCQRNLTNILLTFDFTPSPPSNLCTSRSFVLFLVPCSVSLNEKVHTENISCMNECESNKKNSKTGCCTKNCYSRN